MLSRASGDLLADRRYLYGQAAVAEADHAAAADLFEQTAALVPDWAPAWFSLGEARENLGDREGAAGAFGRAAALDPSGELGAELRLARLGVLPAPAQAPPAYVRSLFDQYAEKFDDHLVEGLRYRGPELLVEALEAACAAANRPCRFERVLDLGCGTGLVAKALGGCAQRISGVDLSPAMVAAAARSGFYDDLVTGELIGDLQGREPASFDLIVAGDVLVYFGDLRPVFSATARALAPGGFFAFTVQAGKTASPSLGADLRYAHSRPHIEAAAASAELRPLVCRNASTRRDGGIDIPGLVVVLAHA